jgi:hypothetical protein
VLPVAAFLTIALVLAVLVALLANDRLLPPITAADYAGPRALRGWYRYDGVWYRHIAVDGYYFRGDDAVSPVAFFPAYPLVMRALSTWFGGDAAMWGVVITWLSGLTIAVLFHRWCAERMHASAARTALALLLSWPYGWFLFGAVYADAMFIALVLAAFTALERDRVLLAVGFGAIATATRPLGLAVVAALLVRNLERRGVLSFSRFSTWTLRLHPAAWRLRHALPLVSVAGLATYMIYLGVRFGDPFAFATAEAAPEWGMEPGPRVWFKVGFFERLAAMPDGGIVYPLGLVFQAALAGTLLSLVPGVARRFGFGYAVYVLVVLAIPLISSKDFHGIGRYALSAFPAFAIAGERLAARPRVAKAVLAVSAAIMVTLCAGYARGKYLA